MPALPALGYYVWGTLPTRVYRDRKGPCNNPHPIVKLRLTAAHSPKSLIRSHFWLITAVVETLSDRLDAEGLACLLGTGVVAPGAASSERQADGARVHERNPPSPDRDNPQRSRPTVRLNSEQWQAATGREAR